MYIVCFLYPPRTCGGEPMAATSASWDTTSAPHMRGRTPAPTAPTCPNLHPPRTCGGEPRQPGARPKHPRSAPHMRGGTLFIGLGTPGMYIRPADAGVNPSEEMASPAGNYPPRTCGGEPYASGVCCAGRGSAPHMRG